MPAKFRAAIRTVEEPLRRAHLSLGVARDRAGDVTSDSAVVRDRLDRISFKCSELWGEVTTLLEDLASLKGGAP